MATLQGQEIKDTYQALLKTDGNTTISSTLQTITDGQGNATALSLANQVTQNQGAFNMGLTGWTTFGGTSGSQYYLYNSSNRTIYLSPVSSLYYQFSFSQNLTSSFPAGTNVTFIHTKLGFLQGTVESSYFYDGEGDALTLIKLTTDPSNGVDDTLDIDTKINPGVFLSNSLPSKGGEYINGLAYTNGGGTSGSQYFVYNSTNRSIYLNAYTLDYSTQITSSLTASFPPGNEITFLHSTLGPLSGVVESSYFYNGEGNPLTIIKLTTDPSNGLDDTYNSIMTTVYTTATTPFGFNTGVNNFTVGMNSNAQGQENLALGSFSHAEGWLTTTFGAHSHAEGYRAIAMGELSHAEGATSTSVGVSSHAEGGATRAIGAYSHTEGGSTTTTGYTSHAEGLLTTAKGYASHAEGWGTISSGSFNGSFDIPQHAEGRWNIPDIDSLLIVGNGTANNARANAFAITTWGTNNVSSSIVTPFVSQSLNYANDTAAAAGGVPLGGFYHNAGALRIRLV